MEIKLDHNNQEKITGLYKSVHNNNLSSPASNTINIVKPNNAEVKNRTNKFSNISSAAIMAGPVYLALAFINVSASIKECLHKSKP